MTARPVASNEASAPTVTDAPACDLHVRARVVDPRLLAGFRQVLQDAVEAPRAAVDHLDVARGVDVAAAILLGREVRAGRQREGQLRQIGLGRHG